MNWKRGFGIGLLFVGVFISMTSRVLTGAVIGFQPQNYLGLLGVVLFIGGLVLMVIGNRSLEDKLKKDNPNIDFNGILDNREKFIKINLHLYKKHLDETNQFPRGLREDQKFDYARRALRELIGPPVIYNQSNAIEFIEFFKQTPNRTQLGERLPEDGKEPQDQIPVPIRINYKITDPFMIESTEHYSTNDELWNRANDLVYRFSLDKIHPGQKAYSVVSGTGGRFIYLKQVGSGARVFLEKESDTEYNLLAVESGEQRKIDEIKAIEKCQEMYDQLMKQRKVEKVNKKS